MIKGLEALNSLIETMPFAFLESNTMKELKIIEKELKAFEIIKKKRVNVDDEMYLTENYKDYKEAFDYLPKDMQLTQEEYDLIKEVLI